MIFQELGPFMVLDGGPRGKVYLPKLATAIMPHPEIIGTSVVCAPGITMQIAGKSDELAAAFINAHQGELPKPEFPKLVTE